MSIKLRIQQKACVLVALLVGGVAIVAVGQDADQPPAAVCENPPNKGKTVPLWGYQVKPTRGDKVQRSGIMVGTCPFDKEGRQQKTGVKTHRVWVQVTMPDGTVFDPTAVNPYLKDKAGKKHSVLEVVGWSPIFQNYGMADGYGKLGPDDVLQGVAKTQYGDFFQRANFWTVINDRGTSKYQAVLSPVDDIFVAITSFRGKVLASKADPARKSGWIPYDEWEGILQATVWPQLRANGITTDSFAIFLVDTVQVCFGSVIEPPNECIPGYHSAVYDRGNLQTYAFADFDNAGLFSEKDGDVNTLSHEVGEWMDNPDVEGDWGKNGATAGNPTPKWGNGIGQVKKGFCQENLEVGDPLSQTSTLYPKLLPWEITIQKPFAYTYHLQELAYFSWFFGRPTIGAGRSGAALARWFSNHGGFTDAAPEVPADCQTGQAGP